MTKERMLELLILGRLVSNYRETCLLNSDNYSSERIISKYRELMEEFLEPYIIDKNSKEN